MATTGFDLGLVFDLYFPTHKSCGSGLGDFSPVFELLQETAGWATEEVSQDEPGSHTTQELPRRSPNDKDFLFAGLDLALKKLHGPFESDHDSGFDEVYDSGSGLPDDPSQPQPNVPITAKEKRGASFSTFVSQNVLKRDHNTSKKRTVNAPSSDRILSQQKVLARLQELQGLASDNPTLVSEPPARRELRKSKSSKASPSSKSIANTSKRSKSTKRRLANPEKVAENPRMPLKFASLFPVAGHPGPGGVHIFVDYSNICSGAHTVMNMRYDTFANIIEKGRVAQRRFLVGSYPIDLSIVKQATRLGYTCKILHKTIQRREQGVDELLQHEMVHSMLDYPAGTMVVATGDGNCEGLSDGFPKEIERALDRGWKIELVTWKSCMNNVYKKMQLEWGDRFSITLLEKYLPLFGPPSGLPSGLPSGSSFRYGSTLSLADVYLNLANPQENYPYGV